MPYAFSLSALDAIAANICVVDSHGRIALVNRAWREFAEANGALPGATGPGASYVDACRAAAAHPDADVRDAARDILDVLEGRQESCATEYSCHAPEQRRWFTASAMRLAGEGAALTIVVHANVTARRESELAARQAEDRIRSLTTLFSDWYWVLDRELRYVLISGQGDERNGTRASSLLGQKRFHGRQFEPLEMSLAEFETLHLRGESYRDVRARIRVSSGDFRVISISGEALLDGRGRVTGYHGVSRDITREYETQVALRRSEARFRSLLELSSDLYWETDREHRLVERAANKGEEANFAHPQEESLGKARWELPYLTPDAKAWAEHRATMDAHLPFWNFEFSRMRPDGTIRYTSISGEPVFDERGEFKGYRGVGSNITRRKREERLLAMEHAVTRQLSEADSVQAGLRAMIRTVCEAKGWACGRYWQLEAASGVMRAQESWSIPDAAVEDYLARSREMEVGPGQGVMGHVLQTGETAWVTDLAGDARAIHPELVRASGLHGSCVVPVLADGRTTGVLAFLGKVIREPDPRLLEALRIIGVLAGQFLQRKRAEAVTRESEARYRSLVGLAADWYWELDENLRLRYVSKEPDTSRSSESDRAIGKLPWELNYVDRDQPKWDAIRATFSARRPFRDFEAITRDGLGTLRTLLVSGHPVFDGDGSFKGYRGISQDVTARRRAELLHALEHAVARSLADNDDPAAAVRDVLRTVCETRAVDCARYFEADEAGGVLRHVADWGLGDPAVQDYLDSSRGSTLRAGEGICGAVWQSGKPVWIADVAKDPRAWNVERLGKAGLRTAFVAPVISDGRTIGVLAFLAKRMREPDERVLRTAQVIGSQLGQYLGRARSQAELRRNEERFRSLTELSSDWYWEQDEECRFVDFSGGINKWGTDQNESIGKRRWEIPGVAPVSGSWDAHRAALAARQPFRDFEYSRVRGDGVVHYVSASGHPVFDAAGRFTGYRGIATDITTRKRAEEDLLRFRAALNASGDTIALVDRASLRYIDANQTFCDLVGHTRDEILAMTPLDLFSADRESLERDYDALIADSNQSAKSVQGEYRRKDGTRVAVESRRHAMRTKDGWIIVASARDITGRIAQEQALRDGNRRLALQARRQRRIAAFGQFALKRRSSDELVAAAVEELADQGDVVAMFERTAEGRLTLRLATGDVAADSVGQTVPLAPDSAALRVLVGGQTVRMAQDYLSAAPEVWPWSVWMRQMRSGVFVPVTHNGHAHGMLGIFSRDAGAIGEEEVNFAASIGNMLSTSLQREHAEQRLAFLAQFDSLTGLPNRSLLEDRLRQTTAQSARNGRHTAALFVDIDRLKLVNDSLGHQAGDMVIREVGRRLQECVRAGDTVGRISGDEFVVVLANLARADDAGVVAQKILDAIAKPFDLAGSESFITASIGISLHPGDGKDTELLLRNADMAMYKAKQTDRNSYRFFTAKMNDRAVAKLQLNTDLRHAIKRREFALHYQPKVDLRSGALTGVEALLRWNHPQRGPVSPAEFIPALEGSGLILPVGEWVLEEACAQIRRWQADGLAPVPVAINLSAKQFRRADLDGIIQRTIVAAGVPAGLIELEITESGIADDPEDAVRQLKNLREAGLTIAVDDFGTGYSSLAYLSNMPLSALKIDRSFIVRMMDDPNTMTLVQTIISLAHSLRLIVVAEGVETEPQARMLRLLRCDQMQGYLFSKPLPPQEMAGLLARAGKTMAA